MFHFCGLWEFPGGKRREGETLTETVRRETAEETGIDPKNIRLVDEDLFDVDIHAIPAVGNDPRHEHIDVRFLVEIDDSLPVPGNDESHEVLWVPLAAVARFNNNRSTHRMLEKTRRMRVNG